MLYLVNVDHVVRDEDWMVETIFHETWRVEAGNYEEMQEIVSEHDGLLCGIIKIDKSIWKVGWKETDELEEVTQPNDKGEE